MIIEQPKTGKTVKQFQQELKLFQVNFVSAEVQQQKVCFCSIANMSESLCFFFSVIQPEM